MQITRLGTQYVLTDEKAIGLVELNEQAPDYSGFRRYQVITVVRDDKPADFRTDLGSINDFIGINQFQIPSLMEHTVGELKEMADILRNRRFDYLELVHIPLYDLYYDHEEKRKKLKKQRKVKKILW